MCTCPDIQTQTYIDMHAYLHYNIIQSDPIQYSTKQYNTRHYIHYITLHFIALHYMNTYIGVCSIVSVHTLAFQVACPCACWVLVTEFNFMVT